MIVVFKTENGFNRLLGSAAPEEGKKYALHALCFTTKTEDGGFLLANLLTREILYLTSEEYVAATCAPDPSSELVRYLIQNRFLTEEQFDPYEAVDSFRTLKKKAVSKRDTFDYFKILPTLDCNARCFYCYQRERYHALTMDEKTVDATADFILRHSRENKRLQLQWHGGEPLYHIRAIDRISTALQNAGRDYTALMISNGYLFDKAVAEKAKSLWHLTRVQITLDGTEAVYNRVKAYIYKDASSPYFRVLDNIELLLDAGLEVLIRVNVDKYNQTDIFNMLDEIGPRFSSYPNAYIYAFGLYDESTHRVKNGDDRLDVYRIIEDFYEKCRAHGLKVTGRFDSHIRLNRCMADADGKIVIFPSGKIGKCDHVPESNTVGTVFDGVTDEAAVQAWKVKSNKAETCRGCAMYADCYRLEKCEDDGPKVCDAAYRAFRHLQIRNNLLFQYNKYLNEQKEL